MVNTKTQKTEDNINVEIGKFYKVRCAKIMRHDKFIEYVPVIGICHKDISFGVRNNHYHIDGRFVVKKSTYYTPTGYTNKILSSDKGPYFLDFVAEIVTKTMKCKRLSTGILPGGNEPYHKWYISMVGKSCAGKKCPHFGTIMHEVDGVLVCPLHGLKGNLKTEVIIKRGEVVKNG